MKYYVSVTETLNKVVSVDAESEVDAEEQVREAYYKCDIVLDEDNFAGVEFEAEDDQKFYADYEKENGETYQHID